MEKIVNSRWSMKTYSAKKTPKNLSINPTMIINIEAFDGHFETWNVINEDWVEDLINKGIITLIEDNENGNIYHNPIVVIRYKDYDNIDNMVVIHFEKYDEALDYFQKLTNRLNFFNLS